MPASIWNAQLQIRGWFRWKTRSSANFVKLAGETDTDLVNRILTTTGVLYTNKLHPASPDQYTLKVLADAYQKMVDEDTQSILLADNRYFTRAGLTLFFAGLPSYNKLSHYYEIDPDQFNSVQNYAKSLLTSHYPCSL